jgi:adenylate cyclase
LSSAEIIVHFNQEERRHILDPAIPYGIGRSPQNAICVPSDTVSRNHALIKQNENGTFCVFDLGSRNGTMLNERLVSAPAVLHDGDRIRMGEVTLVFSQKSELAKPAMYPARDDSSTVLQFSMVQLTVLVVDLRGFTTLSRRIGEQKIAELVHAYNSEAGDILNQSGAWTMKFIGDAVMAIWIRQTGEPPAKTLFTAFGCYEQIHTLVCGLQTRFALEEPVSIGGGINTGYATVGNIGSGTNADYTALGESVNLAFRLESATRNLGCDLMYGPSVEAILKNVMQPESRGKRHTMVLKGYSEECEVYAICVEDVRRMLYHANVATKAE